MLNSRLQNLVAQRDGYLLFIPANLKITGPDAAEKANLLLAKWDRAANRKLTTRELMSGVQHQEDRDRSQRAQDDVAISTHPAFDGNPYRAMVDEYRPAPVHGKVNRAKEYARMADEWDREQAAKLESAADVAQREPIVNHASFSYADVMYDPSAPMSEFAAAKRRLEIAKTGTVDDYRTEDRAYRERRAVKLAAREAEVDGHIAALKASKADLDTGAYDPPAAPAARTHSAYFFQDEISRAGREKTLGVKDE